MATTRTKITKRVVSKILRRKVEGWNDKTERANRIKLKEQLSYNQMQLLDDSLKGMFPEYKFAIGNICWRPQLGGCVLVTAITFWK
jgi:hypothetical protein